MMNSKIKVKSSKFLNTMFDANKNKMSQHLSITFDKGAKCYDLRLPGRNFETSHPRVMWQWLGKPPNWCYSLKP